MPRLHKRRIFSAIFFSLHVIVVNLVSVSIPGLWMVYLWKRRPQFTPVDVIETDVIRQITRPACYVSMRSWFTTIRFLCRYRKSDCERKSSSGRSYDKNQQILIRVNEGATRNNAYYCPQSSYYWKRYFVKAIRCSYGETQQSLTQCIFTDAEIYLPRKKSSFYRPDTFLQWGGWQYWRSFSTVT